MPKKKIIDIRHPKNLENITKIFFNQKRKMIKKSLINLFDNFNDVSKKVNIKLTDRPQNISIKKFFIVIKDYENKLY